MSHINISTVLNRSLPIDENISSIRSRISQINLAINIFNVKPFGVGLGNYYEYVPSYKKNIYYLITDRVQKQQGLIADEYVHNIFGLILAESGVVAAMFFLCLVILFIKNDFYLIKSKNYPKVVFMIAFWLMFIYSLFNPLISGVANYLFWLFRGLSIIDKSRKQNI